jgi:Flp pilus assembly protein TadD
VAKILTKAIDRIFRGDLSEANSQLEKAEDLNSSYFEVRRVRAFYNVTSGDYLAADASYSAAVSLAPDRAPLRVWYGGFISRCLGDQERALTELQQAETLAPNAPAVKIECARVMQYLRHFDDAEQRLNAIANLENQPLRIRRMHLDLLLQNSVRKAEYYVDLGQPENALTCLERAQEVFTNATPDLIDYKILKNLNHARRSFSALRRAFRGSTLSDRLSAIAAWLPFPNEQFLQPRRADSNVHCDTFDKTSVQVAVPPTEQLTSKRMRCHRIEVVSSRSTRTTLLLTPAALGTFFTGARWIGLPDFDAMPEGSIVEFDISTADGKTEAIQVRPIEGMTTGSLIGREVSGELTKKEHSHGFITLDVGGTIFFHMRDCGSSTALRN